MTASNILETTDWSHLLHACGTAEGAVPALKTLQGEDPDAMTQAVDVLEPCFLRQSTPYPATPAALRYVLAVLAEWGAERAEDEQDQARSALRAEQIALEERSRELRERAEPLVKSGYGQYLLDILARERR